jgi:tetratricopeptide (TPR) repeat protein
MSTDLTSRVFSQGLTSFRVNNFREAFGAFRSAHQGDPRNPRYLSYYGLTVALEDENVEQGIQICREAIHLVPFEPEFYLNLSRVYMKAGKRKQALGILQEGLALNHKSKLLASEFAKIDLRRKPFFSLLHRDNILNKILGKLTYRFRRKNRPGQSKK